MTPENILIMKLDQSAIGFIFRLSFQHIISIYVLCYLKQSHATPQLVYIFGLYIHFHKLKPNVCHRRTHLVNNSMFISCNKFQINNKHQFCMLVNMRFIVWPCYGQLYILNNELLLVKQTQR